MKGSEKFVIGVDIGATSIKTGIVGMNGSILNQVSFPTLADRGPALVIEQIIKSIRNSLASYSLEDCMGIGIGAPGVVSNEDGKVRNPPNFSDWDSVDVAKEIKKIYPRRVLVENDANCAALAEARFGAGVDFKDFLFVIWGTGIGGGIILDHKLFRGKDGGAGEIGHVSIDYEGEQCNCGGIGCIESYVGQRYLSKRTKEILLKLNKNERKIIEDLVGGDFDKIEPAILSRAAEMGDPTSISVLENAGKLMGVAFASVLNVLDLEVVIIGGGVSAVPDFVYTSILDSIRARVLKPHRAGIKVIRAKLGNNAGIIGAASLVL